MRLPQHRDSAIEGGTIRRRIDLIEPLVRHHVAAFAKFALLDYAVDPRTDLRHEVRGSASRQFRGHRNG